MRPEIAKELRAEWAKRGIDFDQLRFLDLAVEPTAEGQFRAAAVVREKSAPKELESEERCMRSSEDTPRIKSWRSEIGTPSYAGGAPRDLGMELRENQSLRALMSTGSGTAVLKFNTDGLLFRTTITSAGISVQPERMPGIVPEPRRQLKLQDLITRIPTRSNLVEWLSVSSHSKTAAPVPEASDKPEAALSFEKREEKVRTIATWIPASKQILEDFVGLEAFLRSSLMYALEEEFEDQILLGDGTGENLNGLMVQATLLDTSLLGTNWTRIDVLARAIQQLAMADQPVPDFVILNPADYWSIRLTKDAEGRYILGSPQGPPLQYLFDRLAVVQSTSMAPGQFLLGSSSPDTVQLRMKQETTIEISTEHADYFTKNLVAIRAELRAALVVMRPTAFIKGNLTSSPA
jgi:HK97 family phage major capsid protein